MAYFIRILHRYINLEKIVHYECSSGTLYMDNGDEITFSEEENDMCETALMIFMSNEQGRIYGRT